MTQFMNQKSTRIGGNSHVQPSGRSGKKHASSVVTALHDLKGSMENNKRFGKMVTYSIECVGKMAVSDVSVEEICESGILKTTMDVLKHPNNTMNEDLQITSNRAILRMMRNDHCSVQVSKALNGDLSAFHSALTNHKERESIKSTAEVLGKLAGAPPPEGPKNIAAMKSMGIYDAIADRIADCSIDDAELLSTLANTLATGSNDPDIAQMILDKGILSKLNAALEKDPNNLALATSLARLVGSMATASPNIVAQLRSMGYLDVLAKLGAKFGSDTAIMSIISNAMQYLSSGSDIQQVIAELSNPADITSNFNELLKTTTRTAALLLVEKHRAMFHASQGLTPLISTLQLATRAIDPRTGGFKGDGDAAYALMTPGLLGVIAQSATSIGLLADNDETKVYALMRAGAIQSLLSGLYSLNNAPSLLNPDGSIIDAVNAADGGKGHAVFHGMTSSGETYQYTSTMAESAAGLISAVSAMMTRPENVAYLVKTGTLKESLEIAHRMGENLLMSSSLMDFYQALAPYIESLDSEHQALLFAGLASFISGLRKLEDPAQIIRGFETLGHLAVSEEAELQIIQAGALETVLEMMGKHMDNPEVMEAGLRVLDLACMTQEGRERLIRLGGEELIRKIRELYRDNPEIRALCDNILNSLARHRAGGYDFECDNELYEMEDDPAVTVVTLPASAQMDLSHLNNDASSSSLSKVRKPHSQVNFTDLEVLDPENAQLSKTSSVPVGSMAGTLQGGQTSYNINIQGGQQQYVQQQEEQQQQQRPATSWFGLPIVDVEIEDEEEDEDAGIPAYILEIMALIQSHVSNRRGARLLALYETLATQKQGDDRDYLMTAVVEAIILLVEVEQEREAMEAGVESNSELYDEHRESDYRMSQQAILVGETGRCLSDMNTALVMNGMGSRLARHALSTTGSNLHVQSDLFVTILWQFAPLLSAIGTGIEHCGMGPLPSRRTSDNLPSPNEELEDHERVTALNVLLVGLDAAKADIEGQELMEEENMAFRREAEVLRLRALATSTREEENERILARMEESRKRAQERVDEQRKELEVRMEKVRHDSMQQFEEMQRRVEEARQHQMNQLVQLAREAEVNRMDLERRVASGGEGTGGAIGSVVRLPSKTKEFLKVGGILLKHGEHGKNSRHIYITPNLEYICWKHASSSEVRPSQMMRIAKLTAVKSGRACADLQRGKAQGTLIDKEQKRLLIAQKMQAGILGQSKPGTENTVDWATEAETKAARELEENSAAFFAVFGFDTKNQERGLGFEAPTPEIAQEWVMHLEKLVAYGQSLKQYHGEDTLTMMTNPLYVLTRMEAKVNDLEKAADKTAERNARNKESRHKFLKETFDYDASDKIPEEDDSRSRTSSHSKSQTKSQHSSHNPRSRSNTAHSTADEYSGGSTPSSRGGTMRGRSNTSETRTLDFSHLLKEMEQRNNMQQSTAFNFSSNFVEDPDQDDDMNAPPPPPPMDNDNYPPPPPPMDY